jgi:predicted transposase YdaD
MSGKFDKILKENIKPIEAPLLKKLLGIDPAMLIPYDAKMQITFEREMDHIRIVKHKNKRLDYGLQIEFHTSNEDLRKRNLVHYSFFHNNTGLRLKQVIIYIGRDKPTLIKRNRLRHKDLKHRFKVIILEEVSKDMFIDSDIPEEVIIAILCNYGNDSREEVVQKILSRLSQLEKRETLLQKFQKQLLTLSRLRNMELIVINQMETMNIHYDIEKDGLYLEGIEKGIQKGLEQGIEKGREQGIEQGREEGIEQGIEQGREEGIELEKRNFVQALWSHQEFSFKKMASLVGLDEEQVQKILIDLLQAEYKTVEEATAMLEEYRLRFE